MNRRGFSLLELVIVLALVGLSLALVTPSFSSFAQRLELKTTAQRISGILRYSRSESIQKGKVYQVIFDSGLRQIRIEEPEPEEGEAKTPPRVYPLPKGVQMRDFQVAPVEFSSDLPVIEFYPNGGASGGSLIIDGLEQKIGYRIKVHLLTGMVEIEEV